MYVIIYLHRIIIHASEFRFLWKINQNEQEMFSYFITKNGTVLRRYDSMLFLYVVRCFSCFFIAVLLSLTCSAEGEIYSNKF